LDCYGDDAADRVMLMLLLLIVAAVVHYYYCSHPVYYYWYLVDQLPYSIGRVQSNQSLDKDPGNPTHQKVRNPFRTESSAQLATSCNNSLFHTHIPQDVIVYGLIY
jgi:hypothetical protein